MQSVTGITHFLATDLARVIQQFSEGADRVEVFKVPPRAGDRADIMHHVLRKVMPDGTSEETIITTPDDLTLEALLSNVTAALQAAKATPLSISGVIVPERKVAEGVLIRSVSVVWAAIVEKLNHNWAMAYDIPPHIWEEIIAGAYSKAGFDEVILTPRSGDHGRDVIAIRKGVGSIKILGSVKAYKPGHLITKEQVHALMGVVSLDPNASKGIITTTSDFAPRILADQKLAEAVPHRIELMNGKQLQMWLKDLTRKNEP